MIVGIVTCGTLPPDEPTAFGKYADSSVSITIPPCEADAASDEMLPAAMPAATPTEPFECTSAKTITSSFTRATHETRKESVAASKPSLALKSMVTFANDCCLGSR
ncbi:hypothetical protein TraAM80_06938 [Trypanosoma rangeli]|uniref:Uncharacterized protein n=1 Tax=Trypanosoma rangeli TaxID=5698 RepID=A0A422N805_TRYRA|nr:uncharacterized protein TraAM80_06938 [Trypanosoma rangeli]RNF01624.1 hypothetical protein TraAM80_06938 [Trypanosoma rangeli]|eukprot:RNF01624.1 hypothetical protein TraAM80_06938 [Trypanosoma rangeli]